MAETPSTGPILRRSGEGEAFWFLGNLATIKAAGTETRGALTLVEFLNPPGFAPPLHRHLDEDEMFYILAGSAEFHCDDEVFTAGPGDFVLLPAQMPHTFLVGAGEPLRALQLTTPSGFEGFAAAVGEPAPERRLPDPGPVDVGLLQAAAARHRIELLGPPPRP
ncbi:Cupin 2, conserved barrel domain protein [Acidothermus cellulolyticus 11B]|jgi:mannose-6-phosphate isomerase-like protein (cupin superfamily)|uniref:Cupin 2, conserved barrel domain protein n=1 Tax=Acidothermus cellulolyticus (strain ATCC 43068 / DSM 8971 / 11B) TaxID=351607 RepID=A0LSQ5_ACIC1|nr:cupin domain-containing protein [Acidothermus cellulolyticus]ABK52465.1 Cupin 2, conserved barrel domain protein [Acidothermus cellulolyticus 11B]